MTIRFLAASACAALALTGCANSGASNVPAARPHTTATAAPVPGGTASGARRSTMKISIAIPVKTKTSANGRKGQTVSPSTASLDVVLQTLNGTAQPTDGPYNTLVPLAQLGSCDGGGSGRARARAPQSVSNCYTATVPAPVGDAVYAIAAVDSGMTLLDYAENVAVTVDASGSATLSANLNGVGASVIGYSVVTDPSHESHAPADLVDCPGFVAQYDAGAVCGYDFEFADNSGDDMALALPIAGYLANAVDLTATDLTTHQALNINYNDAPDPANPVHEIDFDPAVPAGAPSGTVLSGGQLTTYFTDVRPDLSEIPAGATDIVEFKAVLMPPATTAFGPNVLLPHAAATAFTWDLPCRNVTVPADDPSGVAEGTVMQFCDPPSNVNLVVH